VRLAACGGILFVEIWHARLTVRQGQHGAADGDDFDGL